MTHDALEGRGAESQAEAAYRPRIAVVGMSAIMPGAEDVDAYWRNIAAGISAVREVPATHWLLSDHFDPDPAAPDKTYSDRGAFLDPVNFDPMAFGVPPANLASTDPAQLLALLAARDLLEDVAGGDFRALDLERTAIVLGTSSTTQLSMILAARSTAPIWRKALRETGLPEPQVEEACRRISDHFVGWQESSFPGLLGNVVAGRIANRFDLGGLNCITDAACASSLAALSASLGELYLGNADMVITGGIDILNDPLMYLCFSKTPAMSPTGDCRPFSGEADGTIMGEGIAMFALKRLDDAERDGNRIYATIAGLGASSDGTAKSVYAPVAVGQARAIRRAYAAAGYAPQDVGLLEAHGTATKVGDQVEVAALRSVFPEEARTQYCALGSVKSQIGHTKAAAGAAGLAKAILSLHAKVLPPTINVDRPNESLELDRSAFYVNTELRPWISNGTPRRAAVSSFGFGGANYHVTLEEYRGRGRSGRAVSTFPQRLLLFSAATAPELVRKVEQADAVCKERGFASAVGESLDAFDSRAQFRLALVSSAADVGAAATAAVARIQADPAAPFALPGGAHYVPGRSATDGGKVAFLFSGQGSQYLGMGGPIAVAFPEARSIWDSHASRGIHHMVFPPGLADPTARPDAERRLTATDVAQPALALASLATLAALQTAGVRCDMVAGHSFGELPALYAAGAFDQDALLDLATARGSAMAGTDGASGAMLAIEAPEDDWQDLLAEWSGRVFLANYNAPGQVSVSGLCADIDEFAARLTECKVRFIRLPVGAAFHSPLVAPAGEAFAAALARTKIVEPQIPVYSNFDGGAFPSDVDAIRRRLAEQITAPVRFADTINALYERGARHFVEVGPGTVLSGLVGRILDSRPHLALSTAPRGSKTATAIVATLGALAAHGVDVDLEGIRAWDEGARPLRARAPLTIPVNSVPIGRKYPPENGEAGLPAPNPEPPGVVQLDNPPLVDLTGEVGLPRTAAAEATTSNTPATPPIELLREIHQRSVEVHQQYLRAMTESHTSFLDMAGRAVSQMSGPAPVAADVAIRNFDHSNASVQQQTAVSESNVAPAFPAPGPARPMPVSVPAQASPPTQPTATESDLVDAPVVTPPGGPVNIVDELMAVVADKTGYPPELLSLDMELEAGLGIDSIKRMEIFAALSEKFPDLQNVDVSLVGELRTFEDVVTLLQGAGDTVSLDTAASADEPLASSSPSTSDGHVERRVVAFVAAEPPHETTAGFEDGSQVSICPIGSSAAAAADSLVEAFRDVGRSATVVMPNESDPGAAVVLVMSSGEGGAEFGVAAAVEALSAARALGTRAGGAGPSCVVVGAGSKDEGGPRNSPWLAGFGALAKTLALEWPTTCVRYIDAARGEDEQDVRVWAGRIVTEVTQGGDTSAVVLAADNVRLVPTLVPQPAITGSDPLQAGDVVVVSGGARGITAAAVRELAGRRPLRFVLLGRTELAEEPTVLMGADSDTEIKQRLIAMATADDRPIDLPTIGADAAAIRQAREARATIAQLERSGSDVRYVCVDVCDADAVKKVLADIHQTWGPVAGLIHGAGVTADKLVVDKDPAHATRVLATKLRGLENLLSATTEDPLRLLVLFSSVVARTGNAGQADYAIANEVLNAVARGEAARRPETCVVRSIGWGPWNGGLVTESVGVQLRARGIGLLTIEDGGRAFLEEIAAGPSGAVDPVISAAP